MRADNSELPGFLSTSIWFSFASVSSIPRCWPGVTSAGGRRSMIGSPEGSEHGALIRGRHEARAPAIGAAKRPATGVVDHDESREAGSFRAETVSHPGADARITHVDLARVHVVMRLDMVVGARVDGANERDLIHFLRHVREELRYIDPALSVFLE